MFFVLIFLELVGIGTLVAEIWTGIAVTGWQGKKPYIEREDQPVHYWCLVSVHLLIGIVLPAIGIYFQLSG